MNFKIRSARIALIAAGILLSPATHAGEREERAVLATAVSGFIEPGYERLLHESDFTLQAVNALCSQASVTNLRAARTSFGSLVEAWSRIEIVRFGPIVEDNRLERMFFFPDRRGIGLRQVQAILASHDASALDADQLAVKSVALQGIGTLEYLLFGADADNLAGGDTFRCGFAAAVAQRIDDTAGELTHAWQEPDGIAKHLSDPGPDHADFRTTQEGLSALLGVFINTTELIIDSRIRPFTGETRADAKPKLAPYWRSGLTGRSLNAHFEALEQLLDVSGMAELLPEDARVAAKSVKFELANARRAVATPKTPLDEAAANEGQRGALQYLLIVTRSIQRIFTEQLAAGLGLAAGFSATDGD